MNNRFSAIQTHDEEFDFLEEEVAPKSANSQETEAPAEPAPVTAAAAHPAPAHEVSPSRQKILDAKVQLHRKMLEEFNLVALEKLPRDQLVGEIHKFVSDYVNRERLALNNAELEEFVGTIVDEMTGLGPLEPLMRDPEINDILINGHENCFAEVNGVLQPIVIPFKDEAHLTRIVQKIVANVGQEN